jgi:hypothetical protein
LATIVSVNVSGLKNMTREVIVPKLRLRGLIYSIQFTVDSLRILNDVNINCVRFEVLTGVKVTMLFFWVV